MNVLILQPPIVQLNAPYPSGAYLSAFFKSLGHKTRWIDLSLELFYEIFSRKGLERLFSLCSQNALALAEKFEESGDSDSAFNLRRYVAQKKLWIDWIDFITAILRPGAKNSIASGFENAHRFVFGAHVPRGLRMENYLARLNHELSTDDARALASLALADLADFINVAFDENFSLVRYAESLTVSESSFTEIERGAASPVLKEFYQPILERLFSNAFFENHAKTLVLISIPFAGTFAAALATGRYFKTHFKNSVYVSLGGGFVSTELRDTDERSLVKYCDALCYDRGYASYKKLLESLESDEAVFKLRKFTSERTIGPLSDEDSEEYKRSLAYEKEITSNLIPDFSDIDFSQYPRLIDDTNPMHRLWSDGSWLKAYLAHGCYWHKCAFCDVTLDYVKGYCPTNVRKLYEGLLSQCEKKGVFGIHFVDEAMPPALMIEFAKENIARGSPITWWGNIRFEKSFTRDTADFLAHGGLIGVSAGLESATADGLNALHKGTDLDTIVGACCAFKEAGILVHAYMIYGYWWETGQTLIDSMETLRQFYASGLLDSCFWHKFVLTRHSKVYKEWAEGKVRDLKPIDPEENKTVPLLARNGLHFEGEKNFDKYGNALNLSLSRWMRGEDLERPVHKWFDFPLPKPSVAKDFVLRKIEKYERKRDNEFSRPAAKSKSFWLGSERIPVGKNKIGWFYMGEFHTAEKDAPDSAFRGKGLCVLP